MVRLLQIIWLYLIIPIALTYIVYQKNIIFNFQIYNYSLLKHYRCIQQAPLLKKYKSIFYFKGSCIITMYNRLSITLTYMMINVPSNMYNYSVIYMTKITEKYMLKCQIYVRYIGTKCVEVMCISYIMKGYAPSSHFIHRYCCLCKVLFMSYIIMKGYILYNKVKLTSALYKVVNGQLIFTIENNINVIRNGE